ncbi:stage III sporulation protein AA [Alkalithermobacter thermoalcaliphilus JW-YL-7 = DSM 7308]|uniref:Stage III sporulation protein AA n=1 Tax=Alkalithermobacter thermoalcaliphilus JW-YL-7 = DSM 7308 TaxID=1121328 RepID=A0A150FRG8_CLOPD|nr:stage III sporulation protein AA [[Clostridium] paradoxum JW-YL-7 = DSM 7308]SHK95154.1 stage III sporulation protein AA [[Clostridium] paradoxum JW-YL-7 = DSM 7308]
MRKLPEEIINSLSRKIRTLIENCDDNLKGEIEEIRLRVNRPLMVIGNNKEYFFEEKGKVSNKLSQTLYIVKNEDIEQTFQIICRYSIHSFLEDIKKGFITIKGGHRVGIGGKVLVDGESIKNIKHISSLNIRISKEVLNCSRRVLRHIIASSDRVHNTLIISPPQCGKTTLLRDIVRNISNGIEELEFNGLKTVVIDERNEISGSYLGVPQMDVGLRTDIIEACPKDIGIMMVLRAMSPNVIVTDEIGNSKEINALYTALNGGVGLITTVHGSGIEDIQNRKELNRLLDRDLFRKVIVLSNRLGPGTIEKIYDLQEKRCLFVS